MSDDPSQVISVFDVDLDLDPIFDVDGTAAVRRRLTPSSTKTLVVAYQPLAARGRSTCKDKGGVNDYVPLRCRQGQRLGVNDQVDVDDPAEFSGEGPRDCFAHPA